MAQVAAAWSMQKEGVTAPIIGSTSIKNLEELIGQWVPPRLLIVTLIVAARYAMLTLDVL